MTLELFVDPGTEVVRSAIISTDGLYRYHLSRGWHPELSRMAFIMLNPSTADAEVDDPTIRRCINFAKREGCGGIEVLNLYALRCTKPEHLLDHPDPEGPDNPLWWALQLYSGLSHVVAAWGSGGLNPLLPPSAALRGYCGADLWCLGRTKDGAPKHPLYTRRDTPLEVW